MYELVNMELQYESDLVSLFDKIKLINALLELNDYDFSRFGSIVMEVGYFFVEQYFDGKITIELASGVAEKLEIVFTYSFPFQSKFGNNAFSHIDRFVSNFNGKMASTTADGVVDLVFRFGNFKSNIVLDTLAIEQFREELKDAEFKQFSVKSKEDLLIDLKERSSRLREMTNYVEMIERSSQEITQLNKELSSKNLELQSSMEKVQQADRTKSQFLANMSHELRTPLNSIIGFSQLISDGLVGEISSEQREIMTDILNSADHLLNLINQILDISKIEAGMMEIKPQKINFSTVFEEVITQLNPLFGSKKLELVGNIDQANSTVFADPIRLKQVLINLLSNAIKFSSEGNQIIVHTNVENEFLKVSVQDFGLGIKEEDQKAIFAEFQQVDDSHTREYQGTGLGLSLCKRLVELHQGRIWVQSKLGEGSTFHFTLMREGFN